MKQLISIYIILFSIASYANAEEIQLNTEVELHDWCKNKATEYFLAKEKTLDGWSASWRIDGNIIDVKATVEADSVKYIVKCRVKKGLTSKLAVISIAESKKTKNTIKVEPGPRPEIEPDKP